MNAGYSQIRVWAKDQATLAKVMADASILLMNDPGWKQGGYSDYFGEFAKWTEPMLIEGKKWDHEKGCLVLSGSSLAMIEISVCERLNVLALVCGCVHAAAEANNALTAAFYASPDEMQTIGSLFGDNWLEASTFDIGNQRLADDLCQYLEAEG